MKSFRYSSRESVFIVILALLILGLDSRLPLGIVGGIPYILLVLIGLYVQNNKLVIFSAVIGTLFTVVGYYISPVGMPDLFVLANRAVTVFMILSLSSVALLLIKSQKNIRILAERDYLTGLHNRHHFIKKATLHIQSWHRYHGPLSLIILDIDHFKNINDRYGHLAGDSVLVTIAEKCKLFVREIDTIARLGGEEFVFLLPSTRLDSALILAERIRHEIENSTFCVDKHIVNITASLGIAEMNHEYWTISDLIRAADTALYRAKENGRNQTRCADKDCNSLSSQFQNEFEYR